MKKYLINIRPAIVKSWQAASCGSDDAARIIFNSAMDAECYHVLIREAAHGRRMIYRADAVNLFTDEPDGPGSMQVEYVAPEENAKIIDRVASMLGIAEDAAASLMFANRYAISLQYAMRSGQAGTWN